MAQFLFLVHNFKESVNVYPLSSKAVHAHNTKQFSLEIIRGDGLPPAGGVVHCRKQRPGARQPVWRLSGEAAPGQTRPHGRLPAGLRLLREQ